MDSLIGQTSGDLESLFYGHCSSEQAFGTRLKCYLGLGSWTVNSKGWRSSKHLERACLLDGLSGIHRTEMWEMSKSLAHVKVRH